MKKFKLTKETKEYFGTTLYRIEALMDFSDVSKGDKGGWIEKEENLSQDGNAWVSGDALVSGNARVYKKIKLIGGYFYHTKQKSEKIEMVDTYDNDYETLACDPKIEPIDEPIKGKKVKIKISGGQILEGELVD